MENNEKTVAHPGYTIHKLLLFISIIILAAYIFYK